MVVRGLRPFGQMFGWSTRRGQELTTLMAQSSPPVAGGYFWLGGVGTPSIYAASVILGGR